jgi:hypothetical protein
MIHVSVFFAHHDKTESRSGIGITRFPPANEFAEAGSTARILNKKTGETLYVVRETSGMLDTVHLK